MRKEEEPRVSHRKSDEGWGKGEEGIEAEVGEYGIRTPMKKRGRGNQRGRRRRTMRSCTYHSGIGAGIV